jgi:hypothetical protein
MKPCISPNTEKVGTFLSDFYTDQFLNTENETNWFCRVRRVKLHVIAKYGEQTSCRFNSAEYSLAFEYLSKFESLYETALGQELGCHVGWLVETCSQPKVSCKYTLKVSHAYRQHILV